ncbi:MAG: hypothetical protein IIZ12_07095, partial [Eggerthellaceae bacterium]|nr:hypothetical protein [Eggerthellaceae bacterium]
MVALVQASNGNSVRPTSPSATMFSPYTGKIVRVFKDQGERRLASTMAAMMLRVVPPDWVFDAIAHVPATKAAYRRRGFD